MSDAINEIRKRRLEKEIARRRRRVKIIKICICTVIILFFASIVIGVSTLILKNKPVKTKSQIEGEIVLIINEDGSLMSRETREVDNEFDKAKFKKFCEKEIDDFNASKAAPETKKRKIERLVRLSKIEQLDNKITVTTEFKDSSAYSDFTGYTLEILPIYYVTDGLMAQDNIFYDLGANSIAPADVKGENVLFIRENVIVVLPREIKALSPYGISRINNSAVEISDLSDNADAFEDTYIVY